MTIGTLVCVALAALVGCGSDATTSDDDADGGAGGSSSAATSGVGGGGPPEQPRSCEQDLLEVLDEAATVGGGLSLAASRDGVVHIGYQDRAIDGLKYARRAPDGRLLVENVQTGDAVGSHVSLAIDDDGVVHVVYRDNTRPALRYLSRAPSGSWSTPVTVDDEGNAGIVPALAVGPGGDLHVAHADATSGASMLRYAHRSAAGSWETPETVEPGGAGVGLAVDAQGGVHVVHGVPVPAELRYAHRAPNGGWTTEVLDPLGRIDPSVAVDARGVHAVYVADGPELRYAFRAPDAAWSVEVLDAGSPVGGGLSIDDDGSGALHVSHRQGLLAGGALHYRRRSPTGSWEPPKVVDPEDRHSHSSLTVDAAGVVHIAYLHGDPHFDLEYARLCPPR